VRSLPEPAQPTKRGAGKQFKGLGGLEEPLKKKAQEAGSRDPANLRLALVPTSVYFLSKTNRKIF